MPILITDRLKLIPLSPYYLKCALENKDFMDKQLGLVPTGIPMSDTIKRSFQLRMYRMAEDYNNWLFYTFWQIILKEKNCSIGEIGFNGPPSPTGELEVGYYIDSVFQCHGYMTEALKELIKWAFNLPDVSYIKACTERNNHASQRVLQKAGLKLYLAENYYWWVLRRNQI